MSEIISTIFSWATLLSHFLILLFIVLLLVRNSVADKIVSLVGENALIISFLISLGGFVGSVVYSDVVGFLPCVLCWIQRIFLFPQVILLGSALLWKDKNILKYTYRLSIIGALFALYHTYTNLGGHSFTPCTAVGGDCAKLYVMEFGYITIPTMSLTVFALLILTFIASKRKSRISNLI